MIQSIDLGFCEYHLSCSNGVFQVWRTTWTESVTMFASKNKQNAINFWLNLVSV